MIDRVVADLGGSWWKCWWGSSFVRRDQFDGSFCFGGEESAGASFLRMDGGAWSTDKDGIIMALLAAEMTAVTGKDPGVHYRELVWRSCQRCSMHRSICPRRGMEGGV